ncbi:MAG: ABC transporter substrate-binding protein [Clostridia bacterium]|nr:ABC transporter substrate-binding protein [Clostridia bacterium]
MKKIISWLCVLSLALSLCAPVALAEDKELRDFEVILDWYPNAMHTFLFIAQEKGYFAEEGLNVTLTPPAGFSDSLSFPVAGRAQVGLYYMSDLVNAYVNEGMPIQVIGAVTQTSLNVLASLTESGIATPDQIKGKIVGYTGGSGLEAKIRTLTAQAGLADTDYELIDIGFDIITALTTKNVDVVGGGMVNSEIIEMQHAGFDVSYWNWVDFGVPQEYNTVFLTSQAQYQQDPELFAAFLRACKKGFDDMKADPEAALALIMSKSSEEYALTEEVEREGFKVLLPIMETESAPFLSMDNAVWSNLMAWMQETQQIDKVVDPAEFVVDVLYGDK